VWSIRRIAGLYAVLLQRPPGGYSVDVASCFVAMPVATPPEAAALYGNDPEHFAHVLEHLFIPAIESAGHTPIRPLAQGADLIQAEIVRNLEQAELVLCDISLLNPNVFFELGIRTALDRPVCLVRDDQTPRIPFDTGILNFHTYHSGLNPWRLQAEVAALANHLSRSAQRADGRNALWRYFGLTHRGTDAINATTDDPEQAGLRVVLDEIRQLRASVEPARRGSRANTEAFWHRDLVKTASDFGPRAVALIEQAAAIADEVGARFEIAQISDDSIVLDLNGYVMWDPRPDEIRTLGQRLGFTVEIVGGQQRRPE
jgi:hypothetical protein